MATFAEYILNEKDFVKKIDAVTYLKKKQNIYFNTPVILKAEIAREFMVTMEIDINRSLVVTACLLCNCLRVDDPDRDIQKPPIEYKKYLNSLGFNDRFCKICIEYTRKGRNPNIKREKESDILELADQFGGLIVHRSDRIAYTVPEALEILVSKNMKGIDNIYLKEFQTFVDIMEGIEV